MSNQIWTEMDDKCKIALWNLCLCLANKKDYVANLAIKNVIDVRYMQEIDIKSFFF